MAKNTVDLFEHALAIEAEREPVTVNVGDVEITLRRTHTGQQVAQWDQLESDVTEKNRKVLLSDELSNEEKAKKTAANQKAYIAALLDHLTVDGTGKETTKKAAENIAALPSESRGRVLQTVAILAGLLSEDGKTIPFGSSSKTKSDTAA